MYKEIIIGSILAVIIFLIIMGYNIFPVLLIAAFAGLLFFILKRNGMLSNLGGKRIVNSSAIQFDDIGGQKSAKQELTEALNFIVRDKDISKMGIRPLKGLLLTGPPGTGKTLLAKAAANYTEAVFISASGSEFIEMYAGVGAQRIRNLFKKAEEAALKENKKRAVIFIDEIEVLGGKRGQNSSHMEYDQTLNELLVKMDGLESNNLETKILIMGATNRVDMLDEALMRPGRFDRVVRVDLPDKDARMQILQIHTNNKPLGEDVELNQIAKDTFGFSGAHLESVANEAAILALREKSSCIGQKHFQEAVDKVMLGEKTDRKPSKEERYRIAVHEVGHAIISEYVRPESVSHITITSRDSALGYMRQKPEEDMYLYTKDYMESQIKIFLAGAAAEVLILKSKSTGSGNDYNEALKMVKRIIFSGMSDLGIISPEDISKNLLAKQCQEILKEQEEAVNQILEENLQSLSDLSQKLMEDESVNGEELRKYLKMQVVIEQG